MGWCRIYLPETINASIYWWRAYAFIGVSYGLWFSAKILHIYFSIYFDCIFTGLTAVTATALGEVTVLFKIERHITLRYAAFIFRYSLFHPMSKNVNFSWYRFLELTLEAVSWANLVSFSTLLYIFASQLIIFTNLFHQYCIAKPTKTNTLSISPSWVMLLELQLDRHIRCLWMTIMHYIQGRWYHDFSSHHGAMSILVTKNARGEIPATDWMKI